MNLSRDGMTANALIPAGAMHQVNCDRPNGPARARRHAIRLPATLAQFAIVAPIAGVVFTAFFVIGLVMPVLPLHVHDRLGMSAFVVGLVSYGQKLVTA